MRGAVLTNEAYDEMGGVEGSIATVAEAVYTRLSKGDKERLPKLFIQLVTRGRGIRGHASPRYDDDCR